MTHSYHRQREYQNHSVGEERGGGGGGRGWFYIQIIIWLCVIAVFVYSIFVHAFIVSGNHHHENSSSHSRHFSEKSEHKQQQQHHHHYKSLDCKDHSFSGSKDYRHHNGSNSHPAGLGSTRSYLRYYSKPNSCCADYLPEPRKLSDRFCRQKVKLEPNKHRLSAMSWIWGQWVDHSITLVKDVPGTRIAIAGVQGIRESEHTISTDLNGKPQYINSLSCFLDASTVYGSDDEFAHTLREHSRGRMRVGYYDYGTGLPADEDNNGKSYLAGDVRAGENSALTAMHTIWLLEHNWWADRLNRDHPDWDDEKIYQQSRACVTAEIQCITYNEFLPALLGKYAPDNDNNNNCYNPILDPSLYNEFSAASYRFGHSMVNEELECSNGQRISLRDAFFVETPLGGNFFNKAKPHEILHGATRQICNEIDTKMVEAMRNFLFSNTSTNPIPPVDLAAMNIARGRHHKLPSYTEMRWMFGGEPVHDWDDMCKDEELKHAMKEEYGEYEWDCVDLWLGLLMEDHEYDVPLGKTLAKMLAHQFTLIRDGDAHFYRWNKRIKKYLTEIENCKLMDVLRRHSKGMSDHAYKRDAFHV